MANFGRKKIAAALAFAAFFGSKASAKTIYPETVGAVGGATLTNNSKTLRKSKSMSNLTKGLIGIGSVLGTVGLVNEGLGIFTNADTWYKGKYSLANGARHLFGKKMTPEQQKELVGKIFDVINSLGNIKFNFFDQEFQKLWIQKLGEKGEKNIQAPSSAEAKKITKEVKYDFMKKKISKDVLSRVKIEKSTEDDEVNAKIDFLLTLNEHSEIFSKLKSDENSELDGWGKVQYSANTVSFIDKNDKIIFVMNEDGSLTVENIINGELTDKFTLMPKN